MVPAAGAASARDLRVETQAAQCLYDLGLLRGTDKGFELGRAPTRAEALTMLIRVLGKEDEALAGQWEHPFTDVAAWAQPYVGYAYENGLTKGTSATTFGASGQASAQMFTTFLLRALGYSDAKGQDFTYENPFTLAEHLGLLTPRVDLQNFLRADVAMECYLALAIDRKGTGRTLAASLISAGVFTQARYDAAYGKVSLEPREMSAEEVFASCAPAVFYLEVYDRNGIPFASGSGFFLDSSGTAVTNYHVIEGASSAKATLSESGAVCEIEGVYDYDIAADWAVIKVKGSGFPYLGRGEAETIVGGATVYAIGSPLGLQNTISQGLISNPSRVAEGVTYIQTSAAISHGSSGGALINKYGEVIGITSATYTEGQNLNLALPVTVLDGYRTDTLTPLSALLPEEEEPVFPAPSGAGQAAAYDWLKQFAIANANTTVFGEEYPTYGLESMLEIDLYLLYDPEQEIVQLISWFESDDPQMGQGNFYTFLDLERTGTRVFVSYGCDMGEESARGSAWMDAQDFDGETALTFGQYEGSTYMRELHGEMASSMVLLSLTFGESLFLFGDAPYSMTDFGFLFY